MQEVPAAVVPGEAVQTLAPAAPSPTPEGAVDASAADGSADAPAVVREMVGSKHVLGFPQAPFHRQPEHLPQGWA